MADFSFVTNNKLKRQLDFLVEIDKMKNIFRRTVIINKLRRENDAEHSWHFAMYAMILEEYSPEHIDINKVIKIALVHDLVEIYAGDTFAYDSEGYKNKKQREIEAANNLFGSIGSEQGNYLRSLWEEFEEKETAESRFANVCDRLQPLIHNYFTDGHTWREGDVSSSQVLERMDIIRTASPELWKVVTEIVDKSIKRGILRP